MAELKQEHVGKYLIRESCGIVERLFCIRGGRNLPWLEWDCPYCNKDNKVIEEE